MYNKVYILDDETHEYERIIEKLNSHKESLNLEIVSEFISPVDFNNRGEFKAKHFEKIKESKPDIIIFDYLLPENEKGTDYVVELNKEDLDFLFFPIHVSQNTNELSDTMSNLQDKIDSNSYSFKLKPKFNSPEFDLTEMITKAQDWLKLNNKIKIDKIVKVIEVEKKKELIGTNIVDIDIIKNNIKKNLTEEVKSDEIILITTGKGIKISGVMYKGSNVKPVKEDDDLGSTYNNYKHYLFTKNKVFYRDDRGKFNNFFKDNFSMRENFIQISKFHCINKDYFEFNGKNQYILKDNTFHDELNKVIEMDKCFIVSKTFTS